MKFGVLGAADIAKRRFLPALEKSEEAQFVLLGVSSEERMPAGNELAGQFNGKCVCGYDSVINSDEIDAIYIPLPPSLHYEWAKRALLAGKHVFVEKPITINSEHTAELIKIAEEKKLVLIENYGFVRHPQTKLIHDLINKGEIGEIRNIRTAFGFPKRPLVDIRHKKALGGGALLDAGGYAIRAGFEFLGPDAMVTTSSLNYLDGYEVDMNGTFSMKNDAGYVLQASFGMDNFYKCEIEIWGQKGLIKAGRLYTAPDNLKPVVTLTTADGETMFEADAADQFLLQIECFVDCIKNEKKRTDMYGEIFRQIQQIEKAFDLAE